MKVVALCPELTPTIVARSNPRQMDSLNRVAAAGARRAVPVPVK